MMFSWKCECVQHYSIGPLRASHARPSYNHEIDSTNWELSKSGSLRSFMISEHHFSHQRQGEREQERQRKRERATAKKMVEMCAQINRNLLSLKQRLRPIFFFFAVAGPDSRREIWSMRYRWKLPIYLLLRCKAYLHRTRTRSLFTAERRISIWNY